MKNISTRLSSIVFIEFVLLYNFDYYAIIRNYILNAHYFDNKYIPSCSSFFLIRIGEASGILKNQSLFIYLYRLYVQSYNIDTLIQIPRILYIVLIVACYLQVNLLHWWHLIVVLTFFALPQISHLPRSFSGRGMTSASTGLYLNRNDFISSGRNGIFYRFTKCGFIRDRANCFKNILRTSGASVKLLPLSRTSALIPTMFIREKKTANGHRRVILETEYRLHFWSTVSAPPLVLL